MDRKESQEDKRVTLNEIHPLTLGDSEKGEELEDAKDKQECEQDPEEEESEAFVVTDEPVIPHGFSPAASLPPHVKSPPAKEPIQSVKLMNGASASLSVLKAMETTLEAYSEASIVYAYGKSPAIISKVSVLANNKGVRFYLVPVGEDHVPPFLGPGKISLQPTMTAATQQE